MEGLAKEALRRLPLAEAVLRLFHYVYAEDFLRGVYERHRGRSYEAMISFAGMVRLMADALLEHDGSGNQSFQRARLAGELKASPRAAYGKLGRVPLSLSMGLLTEAGARLRQLYPASVAATHVPVSLRGMEVLFHDGKKLKHLERRLKVLRDVKGLMLGGKLVVTQSLSTGMALVMNASPDGEAADTPLVPGLLEQARGLIAGPRLHVGDRGFCDLNQPGWFAADPQDHFVIRWHKKVGFHLDESRSAVAGIDRYDRAYEETWGWIGGPKDTRRRYVRRIRLKRPDASEDVIILTDLVDADKYPADDLLEVYLHRWGIERMFQQITEVFHLKKLVGSTPQATVFQAGFCFLLYNMIQLVRAYIAEGQQMPTKDISTEKLFYDVHREMIGVAVVIGMEPLLDLARSWTTAHCQKRLAELLHGKWSELWRKAPSNTHKSPQNKNKRYLPGGHGSVYRLLQQSRTVPAKRVT